VYLADPVCDDVNATLPLELYVVTFYSEYYSTSQGGFFTSYLSSPTDPSLTFQAAKNSNKSKPKSSGSRPFVTRTTLPCLPSSSPVPPALIHIRTLPAWGIVLGVRMGL
jgi:hypothetical protein